MGVDPCFRFEKALYQGSRDAANDQRVGFSRFLKSCGDIGCLADDGQFFDGIAAAHLTSHHQAGVDAYADHQLRVLFRFEPGVQAFLSFENRQPGPNRPLWVVLMGR